MLGGLDATVLRLSEVCDDNEKLRIDDGYFSKLAVLTLRRIESLPHIRLGDTASEFRKGIFDIKADSYIEKGIPFVRIANLKNGLIDVTDIAHISSEAHATESKTALSFGDIVLSKTALPAASFVNLPECNVSQDTIAVRLAPAWKKQLRSGFIAAFLNSRHGLALMERQFQGNVQAHLSLPDGKKLPIPLFGLDLQDTVHNAYLLADKKLQETKIQAEKAEQTLLRALGLEGWRPPELLTYTRRASDAFIAGRLDAEHFQEKFYAARKHLLQVGAIDFIPLTDLLSTLTNGHTPLHHNLSVGEVPFLCAEHVSDFEVNFASKKRILSEHHTGELSRTALQNDDVLLTIKGRVGNAAIVENVLGQVNINQDVAMLRLNNRLPPWYVVAFLNSVFGKLQTEQLCTGGINPFLGLFSIRRFEIPRFADSLMEEIAAQTKDLVHQARTSRRQAHALLEAAKYAVEIAIEQNEQAAMEYLAAMGETT